METSNRFSLTIEYPTAVLYNNDLSASARLLYAEIVVQAEWGEGYCTLSNKEFAEKFALTPRAVQGLLAQLKEAKCIEININRNSSDNKERRKIETI